MGLTVTTLHIPGDASAVLPLLKKGETLRTHSPGWTTILPAASADHGAESLRKLARRIPGVCLYFHYFDDDAFQLLLCEDGKCVSTLASSDMMGKTSHVERFSRAFFGDDSATPALKLVGKCSQVEEQLDLVEEALGLSLMEDVASEPRHVARGTQVFDAVTARLAELKKRKNAYRAVLLTAEEAPENLKRARGFIPPLMELREILLPDGPVQVNINGKWHGSPEGTYIGLAYRDRVPRVALCMTEAGQVRWSFAPEGVACLSIALRSRPGTLLVWDYGPKENVRVWELSLEDGRVLHEGMMMRNSLSLWWLEETGGYVSFWNAPGQCGYILLDAALHPTLERVTPHSCSPAGLTAVEGSVFWSQNPFNDIVVACNVLTGETTEIRLEDRVFFHGLGVDGLLVGTATHKDIQLFDRTGRRVSKHPFKGVPVACEIIGGQMYLRESQDDRIHCFGYEPEIRYWKLEKI